MGVTVEMVRLEPYGFKQPVNPFIHLESIRQAMNFQGASHNLADCHTGIEGSKGILKNDLKKPPHGMDFILIQSGKILPLEEDLSFCGFDQLKDEPSHSGLPAP
jgi:hypothetical protein